MPYMETGIRPVLRAPLASSGVSVGAPSCACSSSFFRLAEVVAHCALNAPESAICDVSHVCVWFVKDGSHVRGGCW